jgi:hypothetical protein
MSPFIRISPEQMLFDADGTYWPIDVYKRLFAKNRNKLTILSNNICPTCSMTYKTWKPILIAASFTTYTPFCRLCNQH